MKNRLPPIRKAAILLVSLDQPTADSLLAQMEPEQADEVRRAILHLGDVDPAEQDEVIAEFFRIGPLIPEQNPPGIELDDSLARRLALPTTPRPSPRRSRPSPLAVSQANPVAAAYSAVDAPDDSPLHILHETTLEKLSPFLKRENPQTIAVVLSHLPPERAGEVLADLPAATQAEVIRRLADLDETDPAAVREIEDGLERWLSEQASDHRRRTAGLAAVSAILTAAPGATRGRIMKNLARYDHQLAGKLRPNRIRFTDLLALDDAALFPVLRAADAELIVLALAGASAQWIERVARALPLDQARALEKGLPHLGPVRLSDVEEAQQALADFAVEMEERGQVKLGTRPRVAKPQASDRAFRV